MNLSTPKMSTLQMELEEDNVIYNTLVTQIRDFFVVTRDDQGKQNRNENDVISVTIKDPVNGSLQDIKVQDCGNGRYTFKYQPNSAGKYQLIVKLNGDDIKGSPFTWGVEQWHLVARNKNNDCLKFLDDNMTLRNTGSRSAFGQVVGNCGFPADLRSSWKFKMNQGQMYLVGVTSCNAAPARNESAQYWENRLKCYVRNGDYSLPKKRSDIADFHEGDIGIVFLNYRILTVFNARSGQTDTWEAKYEPNTVVYPFFSPDGCSQMTLLL